jgi:carboxypeptidase T
LNIRHIGKYSTLSLLIAGAAQAHAPTSQPELVISIGATTKEQRSKIANLGYALDDVHSDRVFIYGSAEDARRLSALGLPTAVNTLPARPFESDEPFDIRATQYHSYERLVGEIKTLEQSYPALVTVLSLGRSLENRDMPLIRISGKSLAEAEALQLPVAFYTGCHHAREHLSVEVPFMFAKYLLSEYGKNPDVTRLVDSREIYIAPMINPDGHTFDFTGKTQGNMWRKNRARNNDGSYGVDLNRNYGYQWGTGGSSTTPTSEVFMGPQPFSEPETQAVKHFVDTQPRMKTLLTFHTFSELILYPWGWTYDPINHADDLKVYQKMAGDMSKWNGYTPQASSDLYIASGDTVDWSYGTHGIFAFTFELSPKSMWQGGFYPGNTAIDPAFKANLKPMLYLLELTDNPHRALTDNLPSFLDTPARRGVGVASYHDALGY